MDELKEIETDADPVDADQARNMLDVVDVAIERALFFLRADEHRISADHSAAFADRLDLLVADIALDIVIFSRVRMRHDGWLGRYGQYVFESGRADVRKIDDYTERFALPDHVAPELGQAVARRAA